MGACERASERDLAAKVRERDQMRIPEEYLIHRHAELERQRHKRVPFLDLYFFFLVPATFSETRDKRVLTTCTEGKDTPKIHQRYTKPRDKDKAT